MNGKRARKEVEPAVPAGPPTRLDALGRNIEEAAREFVRCEAVYGAPFLMSREPIRWGADWSERYEQQFGSEGDVRLERLLALFAESHNLRPFGSYELHVFGYAMQRRLSISERTAMLLAAEEDYRLRAKDTGGVKPFAGSRWWNVYKNFVLLGWGFVQINSDGKATLTYYDDLKESICRCWDDAQRSLLYTASP